MLCDVCSSIDFKRMMACDRLDSKLCSLPKPAFHHRSYTALLNAARNGCELCTAIDEERREEEATADRPIQDMEEIEGRWGWYKRRMRGHPGLISCQFDARRSAISFRRFYTIKQLEAGTEVKDAGLFNVILRIYADEDSPGANFGIPGRPIAVEPDSDAAILCMQRWKADCTANHRESCLPDSEHTLPTRVIDVRGNSSQEPFLHITNGQQGRWIVLSHVWGQQVRYATKSSNLEDMKTSLSMDELPATFRDAIAVTRKLGFQYLWIDSLCIIQNVTQDCAAEIVRMHEYYQNSSLMIAADAGHGDHCGFLQPRPQQSPIAIPFKVERNAASSSVFVQRRPPDQKDPWPLVTREWTLQEDILSPRTVHFQTHQMTWECQTFRYEELKPWTDSSRKSDLLGSSPDSWFRTVAEFSNRDLTYKRDALPALSGIAKEIQARTQWTYKAGLFLEDMHRLLLWAPRWRGVRSRAPSWSWASLDIPRRPQRTPFTREELIVYFEYWYPGFYLEPVSEVIDCVVVPQDGDPFGRVESAVLRMRGPWKEAADWSGFTPYINPEGDGPKKDFGFDRNFDPRLKFAPIERFPDDPTQLICNLDENPLDFADSSQPVLQQLSLLQILRRRYPEGDVIVSLILQRVQEMEGTFRRRGIAQVPIASRHSEVGWETREVQIIQTSSNLVILSTFALLYLIFPYTSKVSHYV